MQKRPLTDSPAPHLSAHLTSPAKYGKTTALVTAPKPHLIGDVDKGLESLFKDDVISPSQLEGIDVADISCYADAFELFKTGWKDGPDGKPYATVSMDTFSSLMSRVIRKQILGGREKMELQDWGLYLERGMAVAMMAHELAMREDGCHTILTFHEADKGGDEGQIAKLGPAVSGQLFDILPGLPNYSFFLRIIRKGIDPKTRQPLMERMIQTAADHRTPAGSRRKLEPFEKPDFTAIWEKVRPK